MRLLTAAMLTMLATTAAQACDGKSYAVPITVGGLAEGGGLVVRLDKARLIKDGPDKYYVSVKDDGVVLGDHVELPQYDTLNFKTRCGTASVGIDRKFSFSGSSMTVTWSYF